GAAQEKGLPRRQFQVEPRSDLQQAGDASPDSQPTRGRLGDAAEDFQQRGLARPVTADHGNALAVPHLKRQVLDRPELAARRLRLAPAAHQALSPPKESFGYNFSP